MKLVEAVPHGFCAGVRRALGKAEEALGKGLPCYLYGEIVHNGRVNGKLRAMGAMPYTREAVPPAVVVIRAHGIEEEERERLLSEGFTLLDATCPVVARNMELLRKAENPVIIGNPGHAEVLSLRSVRPEAPVIKSAGELQGLSGRHEAVLQTTFPEGELSRIREAGKDLVFLNSVCDASVKRRQAVLGILPSVDGLVVVGDPSSANCRALCQLAEDSGKKAWLIKGKEEISQELRSCGIIGITSGASTPEDVFDEVKEDLRDE